MLNDAPRRMPPEKKYLRQGDCFLPLFQGRRKTATIYRWFGGGTGGMPSLPLGIK